MKTNSESSDLNGNPSVSDNNESSEVLSRSLRLARCDLEKDILEAIKDYDARPNVWTVTHFNQRGKTLSHSKDAFFEMVSSLIDKCDSSESDQYAEVVDNCELFRSRIVTLWDEFLSLDLVKESELDQEILDSEKITSEITNTNVATGSEMLVTGTSNEVSNILTHMKIEWILLKFQTMI